MRHKCKLRLAGFSGSLRSGSYNTMLLSNARSILADRATVELVDIAGIPMFNQDFECAPPESVLRMNELVWGCDGVIISTPQYNASFPGVLKNALDWLSRPRGQSCLSGKPTVVIGASIGPTGSAVAQAQLRTILTYLDMVLITHPMVCIGHANEKFDETGALTDKESRQRLESLMDRLLSAISRLNDKG